MHHSHGWGALLPMLLLLAPLAIMIFDLTRFADINVLVRESLDKKS